MMLKRSAESPKSGALRRRALMIVNYEHAFTQWASVEFGGGAAAAGAGKKPVFFTTFYI